MNKSLSYQKELLIDFITSITQLNDFSYIWIGFSFKFYFNAIYSNNYVITWWLFTIYQMIIILDYSSLSHYHHNVLITILNKQSRWGNDTKNLININKLSSCWPRAQLTKALGFCQRCPCNSHYFPLFIVYSVHLRWLFQSIWFCILNLESFYGYCKWIIKD